MKNNVKKVFDILYRIPSKNENIFKTLREKEGIPREMSKCTLSKQSLFGFILKEDII